jgi:hypothetical protein
MSVPSANTGLPVKWIARRSSSLHPGEASLKRRLLLFSFLNSSFFLPTSRARLEPTLVMLRCAGNLVAAG